MVDFTDDMRSDLVELELVAEVVNPEVLDLSTKDLARKVLTRIQEVSSRPVGPDGMKERATLWEGAAALPDH